MAKHDLGADAFTTGQIAELLGVSDNTVKKWLRSGVLDGYRIPHSQHYRVARDSLLRFLRDHKLTAQAARLEAARPLPPDEPHLPSVLLVGLPSGLGGRLCEMLAGKARFWVVDSLFGAGMVLARGADAAAVDVSVGGREEVRMAVARMVEDCRHVVAMIPEDLGATAADSYRMALRGAVVVQHPADPVAVAGVLLGEGARELPQRP